MHNTQHPDDRPRTAQHWTARFAGRLAAAALCAAVAGARDRTTGSTATADRCAADRIVQHAQAEIRKEKDPSAHHYRRCAASIEIALTLAPNDPVLLRYAREAHIAAGDTQHADNALKRLLDADPDDTVAQLALIRTRLATIQTAQRRIGAMDALLDARSIPGSVRSRVAMDAAILAREAGDEAGFAQRLAIAVGLDETHKEAAQLAAAVVLAAENDPLGRVEAAANLVLADPFDPAAHAQLGNEFLRHGALLGAERFLANAIGLYGALGARADDGTLLDYDITAWLRDGAQSVADALKHYETRQVQQINRAKRAAEKNGKDPGEIPEFRASPRDERVKLLVGSALGQSDATRAAIERLEQIWEETLDAAAENLADPELSRDDADALAAIAKATIDDALWLRLWSGTQIELAQASLARQHASDTPSIPQRSAELYEGWLAVRTGNHQAAIGILEPLAETMPKAELGLAVAHEAAGDTRAAARAYAGVAKQQMGSLVGAWAVTRLQQLLGADTVGLGATAAELDAYAKALPMKVDRTAAGELPISMLLVHTELDHGPLRRTTVRVEFRNTSRLTVGLATDRPLRTRVLLTPKVTAAGDTLNIQDAAEVVSLARKMRLKPKTKITADAILGPAVAHALDREAHKGTSVRWRGAQGFGVNAQGEYTAGGPAAARTTSETTRIRAAQQTGALAEAMRTGSDEERCAAARAAIARSLDQATGTDPAEVARALADALPEQSAAVQRFVALVVPGNDESAAFEPVLDAIRARCQSPETDGALLAIGVMRLVQTADDPLLDAAENHADHWVNAIGDAQRQTLAETQSDETEPLGTAPIRGPE